MIVRAVLKILGFLLFKLGFWASAVFALVYGGCCLWAGLTFNTYWFCAGLLASWVLGLMVSLAVKRAKYKPAIKAAAAAQPIEDRSLSAVKNVENEVALKKSDASARVEEPSAEERAEFDRKYLHNETKKAPSETDKLFRSEKERLWKTLETKTVEAAPLVFATRKDPNIFIYEYPDKLQFYRKSGDEMILLSTEYKEEKELK